MLEPSTRSMRYFPMGAENLKSSIRAVDPLFEFGLNKMEESLTSVPFVSLIITGLNSSKGALRKNCPLCQMEYVPDLVISNCALFCRYGISRIILPENVFRTSLMEKISRRIPTGISAKNRICIFFGLVMNKMHCLFKFQQLKRIQPLRISILKLLLI